MREVKLPDGKTAQFSKDTPDEVLHSFAKDYIDNNLNNQAAAQPKIQQQSPISRGEALLETATNIPFAPRIKAGLAAGGAKLAGVKEPIGDLYNEALQDKLTKLGQAREQYPVQSLASEIASGFGLPAAKGLAGVMAMGGAQAIGETKDLTDVGDVATKGIGASLISGAIDRSLKGVGKTYNYIKDQVTTPKVEKILSKVISPEEAGQQAGKLANKIQQGRITTLPELGDESILGLTRILGKTQGSNKIISEFINTKSAGSAKRVGNLLNNNLSAESYFNTLDDTISKRKEVAGPLFTKGYQEGDEALKQAMTMPTTGNVRFGKINELINDDRIKNAILIARKDYGIGRDMPDVSIQTLHGARQVVDDIIGSAKRAGENNKARSYIDLKNKINNVIYDVAPTMKEADKTFAGFSALKNAQEEGLKFNQYRNGEEVKRALSKLSDGEKETFKIGVKDHLMDKVDKSSDRNPAKSIFGSQLEREKIKAVFNNPKEFNNFARRLNDEMRVFDIKQRVVGGSRTDFNLEEQGQLLDKMAKGAVNIKTLGVSNAILATTDAIKKRYYGLNEKTAKELANVIISPQKSIIALNNIAKKAQTKQEKQVIQKFINDYSPIISQKLGATTVYQQPQQQQE